MARVQGIIASGLAAASGPGARAREATEKAERDAEALRDNVAERVSRSRATDQGSATGDNLKSLVGGLGAASVFGGPAGLLVFGVASLLQKKRREGIAAYRQQAAEDSEAFIARSETAINSFEKHAASDDEKAEAEMLRGQWEQLRPLMNHPDPEISSAAILRGQELTGTFDEAFNDWEDERIESENRERDQFEREANRAEGIRDDVFKEGASFGVRQDAYERMLAVEDTAAGDQVLLVNAFKMVDPNSAVLPGEAATAANTAGVPDFLVTAYNRAVRNGERLEPDQRADLIRQAGIQYAVARGDQVDRNTAAIERARDFGVRDDLVPHLTMPVKDQEALPFPVVDPDDATLRRAIGGPVQFDSFEAGRDMIPGPEHIPANSPATRPGEADETLGQTIGRGSEIIGTEAGDLFSDIVVGFRGGRKFTGADGRPYVEYPDGSVERGRVDTNSFSSPFELSRANKDARQQAVEAGAGFDEQNPPSSFDTSPAAIEYRKQRGIPEREPGLFQEGGFFDRRRDERPTN